MIPSDIKYLPALLPGIIFPAHYTFATLDDKTSTGTSTTLVMLNNENIATIQQENVLWNHTDHLGSTVATTNQTGEIVETTDYSAFGHQISRSTYQNTTQTEKYTGHTYDPETDLLYAQARYYRGSLGRFLGQDPVFWELNLTNDGRQVLYNPQAQNSYSYAGNNPIVNKDPSGRFWWKEFYTDWKGYDVTLAAKDNGLLLKAGEVMGGRSVALETIKNNESNIQQASDSTGVSSSFIKSIIYEEQSHQFPPFGGETIIENLFPNKPTGGVGVMQVSKKTSGIDNESLIYSSSVNINAGSSILKDLQNKGFNSARDNAARYNMQGGGDHANRYGDRVNSYLNSGTYKSNYQKASEFIRSTLSK